MHEVIMSYFPTACVVYPIAFNSSGSVGKLAGRNFGRFEAILICNRDGWHQVSGTHDSGPEVKTISCSTLLRMKVYLFINVKMPTTVDIFTFMNRKIAFKAYFLISLYIL